MNNNGNTTKLTITIVIIIVYIFGICFFLHLFNDSFICNVSLKFLKKSSPSPKAPRTKSVSSSESENKRFEWAIDFSPGLVIVSCSEPARWSTPSGGKLGRTVEEGVKTLVGERDETRDSQWVNFHL